MIRSFTFILLSSILAGAAAFAQDAPREAKALDMVYSDVFGGSYLGVEAVEVSKENMSQFALAEVRGVGIGKVIDNSPAAKAGLMQNDVIVSFNDEAVSSVRKLTRLIGEVAPDHTVRITVLRNGAERQVEATLAKREIPNLLTRDFKFENMPPMPGLPGLMELPKDGDPGWKMMPAPKPGEPGVFRWRFGASRHIGVAVTPIGKQLGEFFGAPDGDGLLINGVRENSPAAKAGLRAGDVIIEVDGKQVSGKFDLQRALNEKAEGDVILTIIRDRNRQTVTVTPDAAKDGELLFGEGALKASRPDANVYRYKIERPQTTIAPFTVGPTSPRRIL